MTSLRISHLFAGCVLALATVAPTGSARAQIRPGGQLPQPGQTGPTETKPEGIAEQAPKVPGSLPTTPVLPPPKSKRKKFQLFELDGYFRLRADWFKQFNLGFADDPNGGAPFPVSLGCVAGDAQIAQRACKGTLRSTNIRLRLEPVINIDEKTSVHMQIDAYDNFVLGSTPDGFIGVDSTTPPPPYIPVRAFSPNNVPPYAGRNLDRDSIEVKRVWAEVMTPLGMLKFGRMPSHWGMGLLANAGGYDPFTGNYDLDSDYGDTVDRVLFGTMLPGTKLRAAVATDWPSTAPTSAQVDLYRNRYDAQPFDLDDNDDVYQWIFVLAHIDSPEDFQDLVDQGEVALNYGTYFVWRKQGFDQQGLVIGQSTDPDLYVEREAVAYIPDLWVKLAYKKLLIEAEGVAILGSIGNLQDIGGTLDGDNEEWKIREYGAVARIGYKLLDDSLHLGFESGFASGDQWDNEPPGRTNITRAKAIPGEGDNTINAFRFDFDYEIDLILFRELIGTVTNAIYFRPTFRYDLTDRLTLKAQTVWSFAHKPISTPGNGSMYGIEIDGDIGYHNDGFFAGMSYGVLFPFSALDHPAELGFVGNEDAQTAQTFQGRVVVKF